MIVVSDASPLINLAHIHQLELLRTLYGTVEIPEAVWQEIVVNGTGQPGSAEVHNASWIRRKVVDDRNLVRALRQNLDAGEAEAIALAVESSAQLLLIDERLGRATAHHFGLRYIGLIGVLVEAKQKELISSVKSCLDDLRSVAGFRVSTELYELVLRQQDELD